MLVSFTTIVSVDKTVSWRRTVGPGVALVYCLSGLASANDVPLEIYGRLPSVVLRPLARRTGVASEHFVTPTSVGNCLYPGHCLSAIVYFV